MKKVLLACLFTFPSLAFAGKGSTADYDEKLWHSSCTQQGDLVNSPFSSGPIVIHSLIVTTPTINNNGNSYVRIMVSTVSTYGSWVSTLAAMGCNSSVVSPMPAGHSTTWDVDTYIKQSTSTYSFIDKRGLSDVHIIWDWLDSYLANPTGSLE